MKNYKEVLRDIKGTVFSRHIHNSPRHDIGKVFVFTKGFDTEQLRKRLEDQIGETPKIHEEEAIESMFYVLPCEIPEEMPQNLKDAISNEELQLNAVFIRGATNPYCIESARKTAEELLLNGLKNVEKNPNEVLAWRFKEAKTLLDTAKVLKEYDPALATMEYGEFYFKY